MPRFRTRHVAVCAVFLVALYHFLPREHGLPHLPTSHHVKTAPNAGTRELAAYMNDAKAIPLITDPPPTTLPTQTGCVPPVLVSYADVMSYIRAELMLFAKLGTCVVTSSTMNPFSITSPVPDSVRLCITYAILVLTARVFTQAVSNC